MLLYTANFHTFGPPTFILLDRPIWYFLDRPLFSTGTSTLAQMTVHFKDRSLWPIRTVHLGPDPIRSQFKDLILSALSIILLIDWVSLRTVYFSVRTVYFSIWPFISRKGLHISQKTVKSTSRTVYFTPRPYNNKNCFSGPFTFLPYLTVFFRI